MPRTVMGKSPYRKRKDSVRAFFEYWFTLRGVTSRKNKAELIDVRCEKTITERKNNPETYTLEELWKIQSRLQIPANEFVKLFSEL